MVCPESDVFDLEDTLSSAFISQNGKTIVDMIRNTHEEKNIPEKFNNLQYLIQILVIHSIVVLW